MANKTNCTRGNKEYFRIRRKAGMKQDKNGNWIPDYKVFYGVSKKDAERKYKEYIEKTQICTPKNAVLGDLITQWINNTFINETLAESTKTAYKSAFNNHFKTHKIAGTTPDAINAMMLQDYINNLDCAPTTRKYVYNLLVRYFRYAERAGSGKNIMSAVELPKQSKVIKDNDAIDILTDDEIKKIIETMRAENHRLWFLCLLAVNTGARISELLALTKNDVLNGVLVINKQLPDKADKNALYAPKSASSVREIPLNTQTQQALQIYLNDHDTEGKKNGYTTDVLFTTSTGKYYDRHNINTALNRFYDSHGMKRHAFHAFRHTFGSNLSRAGVPIEETSKLMGHSSINVTMRYYVKIGDERKKSAVDKLPDVFADKSKTQNEIFYRIKIDGIVADYGSNDLAVAVKMALGLIDKEKANHAIINTINGSGETIEQFIISKP